MRSAIYYPTTRIEDPLILKSGLLMWDRLHVIVPSNGYNVHYENEDFRDAWAEIGDYMPPDDVQKSRAHDEILKFINRPLPADHYYHNDSPPEDFYDIYPQKLLPETWDALQAKGIAGAPLDDGDYPFQAQVGVAVMAKLADACAGTTFARVTDRLLAFGMVADRSESGANEATSTVVPMTIPLINTDAIPLKRLIEFRRRERTERRGRDYTRMRHSYADAVAAHIERRKAVTSTNELKDLDRQFEADMSADLKDLRDALGANRIRNFATPAIVAAAVTGVSWMGHHPGLTGAASVAAISAMLRDLQPSEAVRKVVELFKIGDEFSQKQRKTMATHPMAYIYALNRAR